MQPSKLGRSGVALLPSFSLRAAIKSGDAHAILARSSLDEYTFGFRWRFLEFLSRFLEFF